jgi:predicted esterase
VAPWKSSVVSRWIRTVSLAAVVIAGASTAAAQTPTGAPRGTPAPDDCITNIQPTAPGAARVFQCAGDEVRFSVAISPRCAQGGCGIIVDLPGATQTAESVNGDSGLRQRTRDLPFIVINAERPRPGMTPIFAADSDEEVFAFMQRAARVFAADLNRIHIGGFSQGGGITFSILCDPAKSSFIASAVPAASVSRTPNCFGGGSNFNPTAAILFMSGTRDMIATFSQQVDTAMRIVAGIGPVQSTQTVAMGPNGFTQMRITGQNGRILELIRYDNSNPRLGGHCFVGPFVPNTGGCDGPNGFEYGQKILEFYMANPKR